MNNYFNKVVNNLLADDLIILEILYSNDALEKHKAIKNKSLIDLTSDEMSFAHYRNAIQRLEATALIYVSNITKDKSLYISEYGIEALAQKLNKEESA